MSDRTVLIVDDDESIRDVAALCLELYAGWTVLKADGGAAGVDIARRQDPDAILLDYMMPGMDGLTTIKELGRHVATREIPVILITAKAQVGRAQPWDGAKIEGVISKPFDVRTLAQQVSDLLQWPRPAPPTR